MIVNISVLYLVLFPLIGILVAISAYWHYSENLNKHFNYRNPFRKFNYRRSEWVIRTKKALWLESLIRLENLVFLLVYAIVGIGITLFCSSIILAILDIFSVVKWGDEFYNKIPYHSMFFYSYCSLIAIVLATIQYLNSFNDKIVKESDD